jgi:hypothetical protein
VFNSWNKESLLTQLEQSRAQAENANLKLSVVQEQLERQKQMES